MAGPPLDQIQTVTQRAYNWVANSRKPAPANDGVDRGNLCVAMYRSLPLTSKIPPGYNVPGFSGCHYVRHAGNEITVNGVKVPAITITADVIAGDWSTVNVMVGPWPDGQPNLNFLVRRDYRTDIGRTTVQVIYLGKPYNDTRNYPIQLYWGPNLIMSDHRVGAQPVYSGYWGPAIGQRGNKYFLRTEDLVANKLTESESWNWRLNNWCGNQWGNVYNDIHSCLFSKGLELRTDRIYDPAFYQDCNRSHDGCPNDWPMDSNRGTSTAGWGFSHRSKVCIWSQPYTWILAQDPLGLLSQAIHALIKTNNPWHQFYNPWPIGAIVPRPASFTPVGIADWIVANFYRPGVGISMWGVPIIGNDTRASSLRTNQFAILTTLLGYRYRVGNWATYADEMAVILRDVSVGYLGQPAYGVYVKGSGSNVNTICRPDYFGSQLFVWDRLPNGALGLNGFTWLRQTVNDYFNLPVDDADYMLSTIETTATYCQALRTYAYHKYGWLFGWRTSIPGH